MSVDSNIKFAIADDHKIFRDGIKMALGGRPHLKLIWEAEDGKDMMHKLTIKKPDILLMDIRMPELDGINALQLIRKEYEEVKIVVLSMYDDQQMVSKMMEMGANAYLTKTTDPNEIYDAILTCNSASAKQLPGLLCTVCEIGSSNSTVKTTILKSGTTTCKMTKKSFNLHSEPTILSLTYILCTQ